MIRHAIRLLSVSYRLVTVSRGRRPYFTQTGIKRRPVDRYPSETRDSGNSESFLTETDTIVFARYGPKSGATRTGLNPLFRFVENGNGGRDAA